MRSAAPARRRAQRRAPRMHWALNPHTRAPGGRRCAPTSRSGWRWGRSKRIPQTRSRSCSVSGGCGRAAGPAGQRRILERARARAHGRRHGGGGPRASGPLRPPKRARRLPRARASGAGLWPAMQRHVPTGDPDRAAVDEELGSFRRDAALRFSHPYPPTKCGAVGQGGGGGGDVQGSAPTGRASGQRALAACA